MPANISGRRKRLTIGGNDWSDYLIETSPQVEELDLGEGVVRSSVTFTLDVSENLEQATYRLNPTQWAKGTSVLLEIENDAGNGWVVPNSPTGRLFILKEPTSPSVANPIIEIQCGCALAMKDNYAVDADVSGVEVGTATARESIVANILTEAGTTPNLSAIPYPLDYPIPKTSGTFVDLAGKVAIAANHFLYVDSNGEVTNKEVDLDPDTAVMTVTVGQNEVFWEPSEDAETPAEKLIVSGVTYDVDTLGYTETVSEINGVVADVNVFSTSRDPVEPISRVTTRFYPYDSATRSQVTETTEEAIGGDILPVVSVNDSRFFEFYTKSIRTETKFYQGNKLSRKVYREQIVRARAGGRVVLNNKDVLSRMITTELKTTNYYYSGDDLISRITTETKKPANKITNLYAVSAQYDLFVSEKTDSRWQFVGRDRWEVTTQRFIPYFQTLRTLVVAGTVLRGDFIELVGLPAETEVNDDGSTQPPQTQYLSENELTERSIETCVTTTGLGSAGDNPITKDIRVEHATSVEQLDAHGTVHSAFLWGRRYGKRVGIPISDTVLGLSPLDRIDVIDGSYVYRLLLDGLSYVLTENEAYAFFTGIEVGVHPVGSPGLVTRLYEKIEAVSFADSILIEETFSLELGDASIAFQDSIEITESFDLTQASDIEFTDEIVITDSFTFEVPEGNIAFADTIVINESFRLET